MKRIVIVGTSCSGKTTLARELQRRLNIPHIELDAMHWGPNWTPHADFAQRVERAVANDRWVVDGGYATVRHLTWGRADMIVWLDYPMRIVFLRGLNRTIRRAWNRTELWGGNRESFRLSFFDKESILLWVINTWRLRKKSYPPQLREMRAAGKCVVRLRDPKHTELWMQSICV
jgi:adenylate kinase family enzyme